MRIYLLAVGTRMPACVTAGFKDYAARLPRECNLHLVEIPAGKRGKHADVDKVLREEGKRILSAIPQGAGVVALDIKGQPWSTEQLAEHLEDWLRSGRDIALLIGGPEGLGPACHARVEMSWSLSNLTFPHALVRVMVAEQIYRAWSILRSHPYHRS
jgi:23S rRNA (pseudouridine1915-N3)-methyltransferase